ncbi:hypothetical protein [Rhodococcus sp. IEGM 1318]|uniref:hypothetical protein n=1 Tax=Rhodococcus sp. IEGM 1318 TaxID=3082226 RepID=UPI0029535CB0|nr:hypothetical protein [Rhodococcus sp. IEGM 1318]MDV8008967.1 hypothetical protein [Rhodococcus sp. IEGM 1318]
MGVVITETGSVGSVVAGDDVVPAWLAGEVLRPPTSTQTVVAAPRCSAMIALSLTASGVLPTPPFGLAMVTIENPGSGPVMDAMPARWRISADSSFGAIRRLRTVLSRVCK